MNELKEMGIKISIDDFGTGFSSLSYLSIFPIDTLKIDRKFIVNLFKNPRDENLLKAMILMAKSLNLEIVAEGVEQKEHLVFLKENGCDKIQGYYYSPPLSSSKINEYLKIFKKNTSKISKLTPSNTGGPSKLIAGKFFHEERSPS